MSSGDVVNHVTNDVMCFVKVSRLQVSSGGTTIEQKSGVLVLHLYSRARLIFILRETVMAYHEAGRYDRWGGGGGRFNPRDPYGGRGYSNPYGPSSEYDHDYRGRDMTQGDEYDRRIQAAHRRMEESSANSLRTLNECVEMGNDTTVELERQAEVMEGVERRLDEMDVDLEKSKKNMRVIRSPFGGIANYFARRKPVSEITDPKEPSSQTRSKAVSSKPQPPPQQRQYASTGNSKVDSNLDEMEKTLHTLKGIGELINYQLDDSDAQINRVAVKVDRENAKLGKITSDIKRELR